MKNIFLLVDILKSPEGGAEKQIVSLAKFIDKNRYSLIIGCLSRYDKLLSELSNMGIQTVSFNVRRIYDFTGIIQGFRFMRRLKKGKVEILMTYHFGSDVWGVVFGRLAGVPVIISNRRDMGFWRSELHSSVYRFINHFVNRIVVVAEAVKRMVHTKERVPQDKILVIYNGVEVDQVTSSGTRGTGHGSREIYSRHDLGIHEAELVIMHVANIKPIKGHEYLLKAFALVLEEAPYARLVLIGEDEMKGKMQSLAKHLNIEEKVLFLGKRSDVRELLQFADITVLPSLSEGMSNSILEYMAASKPVIATNVGGNPELIQEGINGLLVEKENVEPLKIALLDLINHPERRRLMGHNSLRIARDRFSMDSMILHYESLFRDSIER